jgi:SAM-dependent methyltransferase
MVTPEEPLRTRWDQLTGGTSGRDYAARFDALARRGTDVHGEATFCASLLAPGARVLDAGCGTGRVGVRLHELGFACVGVDADASMLAVARDAAPAVPWFQADLSRMRAADLGGTAEFDMVVAAGNVVPLLAEGTLTRTLEALAVLLGSGGLLVAGFGLDHAHLPHGCPVTSLQEYDEACADAGLTRVERFSTWGRAPFAEPAGYAVSVHARRLEDAPGTARHARDVGHNVAPPDAPVL